MNTCDMHTHSLCSDGTATPAQIVQQAARIGLSAVALTDHNTIEGLPAFLHSVVFYVRAVAVPLQTSLKNVVCVL